jgi:hypothetical protein
MPRGSVMTFTDRWAFSWVWVDNVLPTAIGALCALIMVREGIPLWAFLVAPALCWSIWQIARRLGLRLAFRVALVVSLAVAVLVYLFLFFAVDTDKLYQAVADAGIGVNAVSSDRQTIMVSIQPVSWGPERNRALRAIFSATHTYAKSQKQVRIQWGDAMISTVEIADIEAFIAAKITYREMLNRMEWFGTPDVLPGESTNRQAHRQTDQLLRWGSTSIVPVASGKVGPQPRPMQY